MRHHYYSPVLACQRLPHIDFHGTVLYNALNIINIICIHRLITAVIFHTIITNVHNTHLSRNDWRTVSKQGSLCCRENLFILAWKSNRLCWKACNVPSWKNDLEYTLNACAHLRKSETAPAYTFLVVIGKLFCIFSHPSFRG